MNTPAPSPGFTPNAGDLYTAQKERVTSGITKDVTASRNQFMPQTTAAKAGEPKVFFGSTTTTAGLSDRDIARVESGKAPGRTIDTTMGLEQAKQQFYGWDESTKDKFRTQAALAGYDVEGKADSYLAQLWSQYAGQAAAYYTYGGKKLTPWDVLAMDRNQREAAAKKPKTVTRTSTNIQTSTGMDAHAIFLQAAQQLIGRDPTKSEVKAFQAALNAYEKANPQVTTSTANYNAEGELISETSTTKGGVSQASRDLMAIEDIKKDPEYGAYQAATNGMNWLMEMVSGG